jgi:hypothetical protein
VVLSTIVLRYNKGVLRNMEPIKFTDLSAELKEFVQKHGRFNTDKKGYMIDDKYDCRVSLRDIKEAKEDFYEEE